MLNVKNFLVADYFKEGLRKAGISEDELGNFGQGEENPLKSITMLALSGQDGAGEQLQTILDKFPEDAKANEEGKTIYAYN